MFGQRGVDVKGLGRRHRTCEKKENSVSGIGHHAVSSRDWLEYTVMKEAGTCPLPADRFMFLSLAILWGLYEKAAECAEVAGAWQSFRADVTSCSKAPAWADDSALLHGNALTSCS